MNPDQLETDRLRLVSLGEWSMERLIGLGILILDEQIFLEYEIRVQKDLDGVGEEVLPVELLAVYNVVKRMLFRVWPWSGEIESISISRW